MIPASRDEFKTAILQRLGQGVMQINVDTTGTGAANQDSQVDNLIDFALRKFRDYHYDGTAQSYFKKQLTDADIAAGGFALPDNVVGITGIFDFDSVLYGTGLFSAQYQFVLNNIWSWQVGSLVPFYMAMQHLNLIQQVLVGQKPIRYNVFQNKISIDMDPQLMVAGQWVIVECWISVDPDVYTRIWGDWWLTEYATNLVKRQWGEHMKKYGGVQLPGGVVLNGQQVYDEAQAEILRLEEELHNLELPPLMMLG